MLAGIKFGDVVGPKIPITRILVDLNLAVWYGMYNNYVNIITPHKPWTLSHCTVRENHMTLYMSVKARSSITFSHVYVAHSHFVHALVRI